MFSLEYAERITVDGVKYVLPSTLEQAKLRLAKLETERAHLTQLLLAVERAKEERAKNQQ